MLTVTDITTQAKAIQADQGVTYDRALDLALDANQVERADSKPAAPSTDLTVLSFGAGQDSTAILYMLALDDSFRAKYAPGKLVVVFSDTGDEHPGTYDHLEFIKGFCRSHAIDFFHLTPDQGFHTDKWPGLREFYKRTTTVGSKAYPKTCTDKLKIVPIYNWLSAWVSEAYDLPRSGGIWKGKLPLVKFAEAHGQIRVLIGIAGGEESRVGDGSKSAKWMQKSIKRIYPLIDLGMDRKACQDYITELTLPLPIPSNCMLCPFISEVELLWLHQNHPADFHDWVSIEAAKLAKHADKGDKNLGVWGKRALPQVLADAQVKYADWTPARINEYKMSHGHCVKSKY